MEIKVRKNYLYKSLKIEEGNTAIDFGLLNAGECIELAAAFKQAAEDLEEGYVENSK
jgi:hypothetical protein